MSDVLVDLILQPPVSVEVVTGGVVTTPSEGGAQGPHAETHWTGGTDPLTPEKIGAAAEATVAAMQAELDELVQALNAAVAVSATHATEEELQALSDTLFQVQLSADSALATARGAASQETLNQAVSSLNVQIGQAKAQAASALSIAGLAATKSELGAVSTTATQALTLAQAAAPQEATTLALAGKAALSHTHVVAEVTGLQDALDTKAATAHTHSVAQVSGLQEQLDAKADGVATAQALSEKASASHTHAQADVTGLADALAAKASQADLTNGLAGKSNVGHTHVVADVTGLQPALDGKSPTDHTHATATQTTAGFHSAADKLKLDGVAAGATANATDAQLRDRSTHTGAQAIATVTGLQTALDGKQAGTGYSARQVLYGQADGTLAPRTLGGGTGVTFVESATNGTLTINVAPTSPPALISTPGTSTGAVSTTDKVFVLGSHNSTAIVGAAYAGNPAGVIASYQGSTNGSKGQAVVLGSEFCFSTGLSSVVIGCNGGSNAGTQTVILGSLSCDIASAVTRGVIASSHASLLAATNAVIVASQGVRNATPNSICGGHSSSVTSPSNATTANRAWHLYSNPGTGPTLEVKGTISTGVNFADYAELFENAVRGELPTGSIITLDGDKVRLAGSSDRIDGVVSATPSILGNDTPFSWQGRFERDEWGRVLVQEVLQEVEDLTWDPLLDVLGNVIPGQVRPKVKIPVTVEIESLAYNPAIVQIPRSQRALDWTPVALLGQVRVRIDNTPAIGDYLVPSGAKAGLGTKRSLLSAPLKMGEATLRVIKVLTPYSALKGYGIALCLVR